MKTALYLTAALTLNGVPAQVVVHSSEEFLRQDNTCHQFRIMHLGRDATHDLTASIEDQRSIYEAMALFFPDSCRAGKAGKELPAKKLYRVKADYFLSADRLRVEKFQITINRADNEKTSVSLIQTVPVNPPVPGHVSLRLAIVEAHILMLQKMPQTRPCP